MGWLKRIFGLGKEEEIEKDEGQLPPVSMHGEVECPVCKKTAEARKRHGTLYFYCKHCGTSKYSAISKDHEDSTLDYLVMYYLVSSGISVEPRPENTVVSVSYADEEPIGR